MSFLSVYLLLQLTFTSVHVWVTKFESSCLLHLFTLSPPFSSGVQDSAVSRIGSLQIGQFLEDIIIFTHNYTIDV